MCIRDSNSEKSKMMVFRKGGFLGKCDRWFLEGKELEVVNSYIPILAIHLQLNLVFVKVLAPWQPKSRKQHTIVSEFCVNLTR